MNLEKYLDVAPEVQKALAEGKAVVALESTIIAHGMPYPDNIEVAAMVEDIIRANGAVPATIGIIGGRLKVGLTKEEIKYLGTAKGVWKVSRRDFPIVCSRGYDGATTVAGTMIIAAMAGIKVFVTGGIGGVHRGWEESFDISADLQELANTDVAVVCAGCKSILDIPATLEYLETMGVPVITYRSDEFPAFFSRYSGCKSEMRIDKTEEIAKLITTKYELGLSGGMLIANPVEPEYEVRYEKMEPAIVQALADAKSEGVYGKRMTPFLLSRIKDITGGESLEANKHLVFNNAKVGAKIAAHMEHMEGK